MMIRCDLMHAFFILLMGWLLTLILSASPLLADATLSLYPTYHSMGVILTLDAGDDPDTDATVQLSYRTGSEAFRNGFPLSRIAETRFVSSLFMLESAAAYDVRVTISDPDGGPLNGAVRQAVQTTRSELVIPVPTRSYIVKPSGSGDVCTTESACSLERALELAQPGQEIVLTGGVYYQGGLQPTNSGLAGAPIVIRTAAGQTAVLDGSDPALEDPLWDHQGEGVYTTPLNTPNPHYVMAADKRLFPYQDPDNLRTLSRGVAGFLASGLTLSVHLENDLDPNTVVTAVSRHNHAFYLDGHNNIYFRGLTFRYYGQGSWSKAIYLNNASDNLIQDCIFAYNDLGIGIKRASHGNTIEGNQFYDTIFHWPWSDIKSVGGLEDGGITFYEPMTGRGTVIRRNVFHDDFDALGTSPSETAGLTNETDVYENTFYNLGDDGISADGRSSNVRIWGNTFYDVLIGISLAPVYDGPTYAFRNLVYRTGVGNNNYPGSAFKFNSGYNTSGPMFLFHNTSDAFYTGHSGVDIKSPGTWTKVYARNNIWSGTAYAIYNVNTTQPVDLDYDGLFTSQPNELVFWGNGSDRHMRDLATFQQKTGQELNGVACAPGFADAAGGNYHLLPTSCMKDRGVVIPGINDGYAGSAPDMGAFEYLPAENLGDVENILKTLSLQIPSPPAKDLDSNRQVNSADAVYGLQDIGGLR